MSMRCAAQFLVGLAVLGGLSVRAGTGSGAPISTACGTKGAVVQESGPITEYDAKWPVKGGSLGQDYAEFGSVRPDKYHAGVDITAPEGTPVYAIAEGIVVDKLETDISATNFKKDNRCMGRVVIVDHAENFVGRGRYSLYAHLRQISDALPEPGERVKLGGEIGTVGRSGFDASSRKICRSPAGPHLHLEIKDQPILENPIGGNACNTGPCWGYTPNYPDDYGYHDPILMLHRTAPLSPAIRVRITAKGASEPGLPIRVGPDVSYRAFQRFSTPGVEFEAIREVATTSPACSLGWYHVRPTDHGCFPDQPDGSGGFIPEGWMCKGKDNAVWIEPSGIAPATLNPTWTQKFPDSVPTPERSGFDIAFDGARGEGVLFGGSNNAIPLNDTWIWNGINWIRKRPGSSPSARSGHAMAYDERNREVLLFGGALGGPGLSDETWAWNGITWTQKTPVNFPSARWRHAMAYDSARGEVVLFGGNDAVTGWVNDTWVWDGSNWTQRSPTSRPSPRFEHAMAFDLERDQVLLYGGHGSYYLVLGDTWIWDGTNWVQKSPVQSPRPKALHAMVYNPARAQIILFGGHSTYSGGNTGSAKYVNETWAWNGTNWMEMALSSSPPPAAGHRMVYDDARKQVMLFNNYIGTWISD